MKHPVNNNEVQAYESQRNFGLAEKQYARRAFYIILIVIALLFVLCWIL